MISVNKKVIELEVRLTWKFLADDSDDELKIGEFMSAAQKRIKDMVGAHAIHCEWFSRKSYISVNDFEELNRLYNADKVWEGDQ